MYPVDLENHRFFVKYEDLAQLIQDYIETIVTAGRLMGYKVRMGVDIDNFSKKPEMNYLYISVNGGNSFDLNFHLKDNSNEFDYLEIHYINSNGNFTSWTSRERKFKYILQKARYLLTRGFPIEI